MNEFKNYLKYLLGIKKKTIEDIIYDCIKEIDDNYGFGNLSENDGVTRDEIRRLKNGILGSYGKYKEYKNFNI